MNITWDIEANNLLNSSSIDYTQSPYKLKDSFHMHCIVVEVHETSEIVAFYDGETYELDGREFVEEDLLGFSYPLKDYEPVKYTHRQLKDFPKFVEENDIEIVVAHNGINYDFLVCKLYLGMDYEVEPDTWMGKKITIEDTLVRSKTQNPDRFGGHSLDKLSEKVGLRKINFRPHIPDEYKFETFAADMLYYCIRDVKVNTLVYRWLLEEAGDWNWQKALSLEKAVAEIVTRQEHRGFKFNKELAEANIEELDKLMAEKKAKVEPILPKKKATKGFMDDYTPPVRQITVKGELTSYIKKFAEKIGAEIIGNTGDYSLIFNGVTYKLPMAQEPLLTTQVASINDTTHIKEWLVGEFNWQPSEYKERDLTVNSKKEKLSEEKYKEVVDKNVEQTLNSPFCLDRCEFLETSPEGLRSKLLKRKTGRSVKVLTNPSFTRGQEKEICPNLEALTEQFPYAKDMVEYLTYKHRRNSILGGGLEWDEEEDAEKGYLAYVREDGRIPTPADTCGAATSRFKHRVVANIPRKTSLYGEKMRGLFGVEDGFIQIGYDFDSLEAREEASYCWKYEQEPRPYCNSLLLDKPNDVHTQMAKKISEIISKIFERSPAKSVKYGITYGASEAKVAKIIGSSYAVGKQVFDAFWLAAAPLKGLKDRLQAYWESKGKKFILGLDGRKVPTRSAHSTLNSLFQSAGVLCAKMAMVIHDRKLKETGLSVDFFKEDWKSKKFCQQLIAYHDEAQLEVSRSLVTLKTFASEDLAKEYKKQQETDTGLIWSDIGHIGDKWYVGYSLAGELAVKSVKEAGEFYKLNVPLTAGYTLGKNWAQCH